MTENQIKFAPGIT